MKHKKHNILFWAQGLMLAFVLAACEGDTIEPPLLPQNLIVEYKVPVINLPEGEDALYGSIDHTANTITVYVPFFLSLGSIEPEIKVTEGAALKDEVEPVIVTEIDRTYTVTGKDGSSRTYKLSIVTRGPPSLTVDFTSRVSSLESAFPTVGNPNESLPIQADLYSYNAETLTAKITSQETGRVWELDVREVEIKKSDDLGYWFSLRIPAEVTEGDYYNVEIGFLGNTAKIERPLLIKYLEPRITGGVTRVTRGQKWEFKPEKGYVLLGLTKLEAEIAGERRNLPIESSERLRAVIDVPADLPLSENRPGLLYATYSDWEGEVTHRTIAFIVQE